MVRRTPLQHLLPEERLLCLLARLHSPGALERAWSMLDEPIDWDRLWGLAHRHEVLPLVWSHVRTRPERRSAIPDAFAARAERRYLATMLRNAARIEELERVMRALAAESIEVMPVKGPMIAETVYRNPALRVFDDLDILVPSPRIEAARLVLQKLGYGTRAIPQFAEVTHHFHDLQYFRDVAGGELCLELHWDLWSPQRFRSDIDGLWNRSRTASVANVPVRILADEDVVLHLAIHRTTAPLRLRMVCDVAELVRDRGDRLDWEGLVGRAETLGARTALHVVLALAVDLLGAPVPDAVLQRTRPGAVKRWILDRTCGVHALFRPAADDDLKQQPHLVYRIAEQDGLAQITRSALAAIARKPAKWQYQQRTSALDPERTRDG